MKGKWLAVLVAALALGLANTAQAAGDADAGMEKAKKCVACHGAKGEGKKKNPPLAGMASDQFAKAMAEYKDGTRDHKMMAKFSANLSDEDIADLAAYYAALK